MGIYFLDKEAHAIRQIYYYDSIRESGQNLDRDSHIEKSRKYIPLSCSKKNRLEEWLVFLSQDDPDMIIKLLNQNADFQEIYEEVYTICLNMERMMEMFSKELAILDRNTVKLMIDEMEEEVVEAKRKADEAVRKADETESRADEAESRADEAESRAKQAEHREKQAREEVDNLKKELEKMKNI